MTTRVAIVAIVALAAAASVTVELEDERSPLPFGEGAMGYGSRTRAGDPDDVVLVTTDAATGPGSLHALATDPANSGKTIGFSTGHVITLTAHIEPRDVANVTIDGLTSPDSTPTIRGPGIRKNPLFEIKGSRGCHDWAFVGLRFKDGGDDGFIRFEEGFENGVIARCSFHGAADEQVSVAADPTPSSRVTVQLCLLHQTAGSGGILLWGGGYTTVRGCLIDTRERYPRVRMSSIAQVVNNVFFDWGAHAARLSDGGGGDFIGNLWVPTRRSDRGDAVVIDRDAGPVHLAGNVGLGGARADAPTSRTPITAAEVSVLTAEEAYEVVLSHAGAPLLTDSPSSRDDDDRRVLDAVRARVAALGM